MGFGSAAAKMKEEKRPKLLPVRLAVLKALAPREDIVTLDFETYYDDEYTLRKMSTSEYIRHKKFQALMCGVKVGTGPTIVLDLPSMKRRFKQIDWTKHDLLCHNTNFDGLILSHHFGVVPRRYMCTLSMARGLHGNDIRGGLGVVGEFYGVGNKLPDILDKAKGMNADQLMATTCKSIGLTGPGFRNTLWDAMKEYCGVDVELCNDIFYKMLPDFAERELILVDHFVRMFCDPILEVDRPRVQKELEREIAEKEKKLLAAVGSKQEQVKLILLLGRVKALEHAKKELGKNAAFSEMLMSCGVAPPMKPSPTNRERMIHAFAKDDEDFIALLEHPNPQVRDLVEARLSVKSTTNETRAARFLTASENGMKIPLMIQYYGAHTGRPTGGDKNNPLNLMRGGELRKSLLAPKGYNAVVSDSGQIEARFLAWLAEQQDSLDQFARSDAGLDRDPYCLFADDVYGREITKSDKDERHVGKVCKLGLGYQMGPPRLQTTLALGALGGKPMFMELSECQRIVYLYRRKHARIEAFWDFCNQIIRDMVRGRKGEYKCIRWEKERIWLPNNMCLKYPGIREKQHELGTDYEYDRNGKASKIYGGLLTENLVQALCNVIITDQMIEVGKRWRHVTMTYDELVTIAKIKDAKKCYADMLKVMATPPSWCSDLPLSSEGGYAQYYSK